MATKKRTKPKVDQRRIYVLLPQTVQVPQGRGSHKKIVTKKMESGRLMAQVGHVVTQLRTDPDVLQEYGRKPLTTITLAVRNSRELTKLMGDLSAVTSVWDFEDDNLPFYGTKRKVRTAVATAPVYREQVDDLLGHLERYKGPGE